MTSKFLQRHFTGVRSSSCGKIKITAPAPQGGFPVPFQRFPIVIALAGAAFAQSGAPVIGSAGSAYGGSGTTRDVVRAGLRQLGERTRKGGGRIASQHPRWGFGGVPAG